MSWEKLTLEHLRGIARHYNKDVKIMAIAKMKKNDLITELKKHLNIDYDGGKIHHKTENKTYKFRLEDEKKEEKKPAEKKEEKKLAEKKEEKKPEKKEEKKPEKKEEKKPEKKEEKKEETPIERKQAFDRIDLLIEELKSIDKKKKTFEYNYGSRVGFRKFSEYQEIETSQYKIKDEIEKLINKYPLTKKEINSKNFDKRDYYDLITIKRGVYGGKITDEEELKRARRYERQDRKSYSSGGNYDRYGQNLNDYS